MSVEGAGPGRGAEDGRATAELPERAGNEDEVVPETRDVRGISDLTYRIITPYLSNSLLHKALRIALIVLVAVCLVATGVRMSPLPLVPIPLFGLSYYGLRRMRAAGDDRSLLVWFLTLLGAGLVGFYVLSVVARMVA